MKENSVVVRIFFGLLFFGLFLGDGKQSVVEVFGVACTLVLLVYYVLQNARLVELPARVSKAWGVFFLFVFLSTTTSGSIGLSLSWLARLLCGYLVYRIFFSMATEPVYKTFLSHTLFFVFFVGVMWCASAIFPQFYEALPTMNLIDVRYGHSHMADLLVFAAPAVAWMLANEKMSVFVRIAGLVAYVVATIATRSRGAWAVILVFIFVRMMQSRYKKTIVIIIFVLTTSILVYASLFQRAPTKSLYANKTLSWFDRVIRKPTVFSRVEYWRQSLYALRERPILGSGPGTFSLVSVRLQKGAGLSSWFAHSAPLQAASELGLLGVGSLILLISTHLAEWRNKRASQKYRWEQFNTAAWMTLLVLAYSLFEFVLDYFIMWLLVWAGIGLCFGKARSVGHSPRS